MVVDGAVFDDFLMQRNKITFGLSRIRFLSSGIGGMAHGVGFSG
jgi:hypothetical protein